MLRLPSSILSYINNTHKDGPSSYTFDSKKTTTSDVTTSSRVHRFETGIMQQAEAVLMTPVYTAILGCMIGFGYGLWKIACPNNRYEIKEQYEEELLGEFVEKADRNRGKARKMASVAGLVALFAPQKLMWNRYWSEVSFTFETLSISLMTAEVGAALGFGAANLLVILVKNFLFEFTVKPFLGA